MKNPKNVKKIRLSLIEQKKPKTSKNFLNKVSISDNIRSQINKYQKQMTNTITVSRSKPIYFTTNNYLEIFPNSTQKFNSNNNKNYNHTNVNSFSISIKEKKKNSTQVKRNNKKIKKIINYKANIKSFSSVRLIELHKYKQKNDNSKLNSLKSVNYINNKKHKKISKINYSNIDKKRDVSEKIGEKYTTRKTSFSNQKNIKNKIRTENINLDSNNSETDELSELSKLSDNISENTNKLIINIKIRKLLIKIINKQNRKATLKHYINKWYEKVFFDSGNIEIGFSPIIRKTKFSMGDYLKISDIFGLRKNKSKNNKTQQFNVKNTRNNINNIPLGYFCTLNLNNKENQNVRLLNSKYRGSAGKLRKKNASAQKHPANKKLTLSKKSSCVVRLQKHSSSKIGKKLFSNQGKKSRYGECNKSKEKTMVIKIDFCK